MAKKVQVVALVDRGIRHRLDALRIVLGCSRARVMEQAFELFLNKLEGRNSMDLERLNKLARARGLSTQDFVAEYAAHHPQGYGPTLEELEAAGGHITSAA